MQLDTSFLCKLPPSSARAQTITESVAIFICKDLRPYSVVENAGFQKMLHTLEPRYAIPTRKHMTEVAVSKVYTEICADLCTLTEADITAAEDVAQALKPLKKATLVMSQEGTPTLSVIAPLRARLLEMQPAPNDSVMVKEMKSAVRQDLQKRYMGLKDELSLASAVDPRFKALSFLSDDEREEIFARLITITEALATDKSCQSGPINAAYSEAGEVLEQQAEPTDDPGPPSKKARDSCALADLLGNTYTPVAVSRTANDKALDEVMRYKEHK
ncbi:hypothetical protein ABVT39_010551 [Epinephelus coioides]